MSVYCFISFAKKLPQKRKVNYRGPVTVLPYKTLKEIPYKMGLQAPIVLNSSVGSLCALSIDSCTVFSVIKTSKRKSIDTAGSDAFILVNLPNVKGDTFEAKQKNCFTISRNVTQTFAWWGAQTGTNLQMKAKFTEFRPSFSRNFRTRAKW